MAELLSDLLRAEADTLDVPPAPVHEIVTAGRGMRRRRRWSGTLVMAAAAASVVVGGLVLSPGLRDDLPPDPSVALHERVDATFSASETAAAQEALRSDGAYAVGSRVYLGDEAYGVEVGDPAVRGLYYTSAGVLVRHGKDYAMDGSSRDSYSLVGTDGSLTGLDLRIGDVSPSTDPTQPYFAYARRGSESDWEVVLLDLRDGTPAAIVPLDGDFTWGGWAAPPVALSGERVYVGLDDATVAVEWHTGEVTRTPLPASSYPDVNADRYLQVDNGVSDDGMELAARVQVRDALTGDTLFDVDAGDRWASLSPDGRYVLILPYLLVGDRGQVQRTEGAKLHDITTGATMALPASEVGGYGWTPEGRLFSVTRHDVTMCDPQARACETRPLGADITDEDLATIRLGGVVNES